jgi:LysM repeat protein
MLFNFKIIRGWLIAIFALHAVCLEGARSRYYSYDEDKNIILREILDGLDELRQDVKNHEAEIRMFEDKARNQEEIVEAWQKQISEELAALKELLRKQNLHIESRLAEQESSFKGTSSNLKSYADDTSNSLFSYKKKIEELSQTIERQNSNIEHLQSALHGLMELMQNSSAPTETSAKIYRVKAGDTLEKIAKQNKISIKKLKEWNQLAGDQIKIGQKLQLSE